MKYYNALNGLSQKDPKRYKKINAVLTEKNNQKKDLLDVVETVPLDYAENTVSEEMNPEEIIIANEEAEVVQNAISNLANCHSRITKKSRLESTIRLRYEHEWKIEQIADSFNITVGRVNEIKRRALIILRDELTTQGI